MADHRADLHRALMDVQGVRREAQAALDEHVEANLATPAVDGPRNEEVEQSLAALVRLLDAAVKNLQDAIAALDQRDRVVRARPAR